MSATRRSVSERAIKGLDVPSHGVVLVQDWDIVDSSRVEDDVSRTLGPVHVLFDTDLPVHFKAGRIGPATNELDDCIRAISRMQGTRKSYAN
jgi:hypothetical protein